jgi:putative membrane protein
MWGDGMDPAWFWVYGLVAMFSLVLVIVWSVRALRNDSDSPVGPRRSAARRALDERFERGEISSEQYNTELRNLGDES